MLTSHPAGSPEAVHHRANAAQSLASCAEHCSACADACLAEDTVADLRRCIRMDLDCADLCGAAARVVARQTGGDAAMVSSLLTACMEACDRCAEECEQHAAHHAHCAWCAEACRRASAACAALLEAVVQDGVAP